MGCAGYVVGGLRRLCGGSWYILYPLRGPTCKSCKISSKAEIPKLDPSVAIIILEGLGGRGLNKKILLEPGEGGCKVDQTIPNTS